MSKLTQLSNRDILFIAGENSRTYHHTAGLVLLEKKGRSAIGFDEFRGHVIERVSRIPHLHWRLHEVPLGLDMPYWVEDEKFSYDHHIKRIAVPSPGDREALGEVVSHLYAKHLDRSRPLWEIWFIEGLAGGRCAILQKLHHGLMDGQGAMKLGEVMCDLEPGAPPRELESTIADARAGDAPEQWQQYVNAADHLSRIPGRVGREMIDLLQSRVRKRFAGSAEVEQEKPPVPATFFNGDIGSDRGFVFASVPLAAVKKIKSHFEVTVNDVVLALVGTSLREYMLAIGELPQQSLRTNIAVSLRTEGDSEFSNRVTQTPVTLATDTADPIERLRAIHGESETAKRRAHGGGKSIVEVMQLMPPLAISALANLTTPEQSAAMIGANLTVSNVRGNAQPMYIAGARMLTMYPMSLIAPGMGINVTCVSYAGNIDFGITIDPRLFPAPWALVDGLESALSEYLALVAPQRKARRKAPARKPAAKKNTHRKPAKKKAKTTPKRPARRRQQAASASAERS